MFSKKQIEFMQRIGLTINFENPSDDELGIVEEKVSEYLQEYGFDKEYNPTEDGKICESILDSL